MKKIINFVEVSKNNFSNVLSYETNAILWSLTDTHVTDT